MANCGSIRFLLCFSGDLFSVFAMFLNELGIKNTNGKKYTNFASVLLLFLLLYSGNISL